MSEEARPRARWQVLFALTFTALVLTGVALELTAEGRTLACAARVAREGSPDETRAAVAALEALGDAGAPQLLLFAYDTTPGPLEVREGAEYAGLVPADAVCDLALDALRGMREGEYAARAFAWEAVSGKSYGQALHEFRTRELDRALEWWKEKHAPRGGPGRGGEGP